MTEFFYSFLLESAYQKKSLLMAAAGREDAHAILEDLCAHITAADLDLKDESNLTALDIARFNHCDEAEVTLLHAKARLD